MKTILLFFVFFFSTLQAQNYNFRWGIISDQEFTLTEVNFDLMLLP
ncbi:hypothetical protein ACF3NR_09820 [Vaginella massiliensis]|nr:hypothetical protein [Vaginella massiliensis]